MGFDEILFTNYQPVDVELVFDNVLDRVYSIEGPLSSWDYSYLLKTTDPAEYEVMKTDFIRENYIEYKDECWKPVDFEEAENIEKESEIE